MRFTMLSKIYRCWTVYDHSWRVVCLPTIFWLGSLTCVVLVIYFNNLLSVTVKWEEFTRRVPLFEDGITAFYSTNIATNLFSTGMKFLFCFVI
jgi:hypothetical protein